MFHLISVYSVNYICTEKFEFSNGSHITSVSVKVLVTCVHMIRTNKFTVTRLTAAAVCGRWCVAQNLLYRDGFCENIVSNYRQHKCTQKTIITIL